MNARERLQIMVRTDRGSMTVWSPGEVIAALDAFRAEVLREEARNLRKVEREDTPQGALGTRTGLLRSALILDERADEASPAAVPVPDETAGDETGEADAFEYGLRTGPGDVWLKRHLSQEDRERLLQQGAVKVRRTVRYGAWTEVTS